MQVTHWIEVDGARLAAEFVPAADARAAAVVMLHAGVADGRMWGAQQAMLAASLSTLRYDRRGFGATEMQRSAEHSRVADLIAVLDACGVQRGVFVGCSQGGRVALDLALAHPDRVQALVLVAPAVSGAPAAELSGRALALSEAIDAAEAAPQPDLEAVNRLEAELWLDGPASAAGRIGGAARELFLDMNGVALRAEDPGPVVEPPPAWPRLHTLGCPTLVLWGDLDLPHLQERCEQLVQLIPGARRVVIEGAAHLPPLEVPGRFNAALAAFLASALGQDV